MIKLRISVDKRAHPCYTVTVPKRKKEVCTMYECACGYLYDPALGDPDNGIEPGTAFEDLPDDWTCPLCGLGKDSFTEV